MDELREEIANYIDEGLDVEYHASPTGRKFTAYRWTDRILALIKEKECTIQSLNKVELLTVEEVKDWIQKSFSHLNPDVAPFFYMGIEALYVKLGGERFLIIKSKEIKEGENGS